VLLGERGGPFRRQAGVHHHPAQRSVGVQQRLHAQPVQQRARVVGEQHALQVRIDLALLFGLAFADREQRQVVVAEHDDALRAQRMHESQVSSDWPPRLTRSPQNHRRSTAGSKRMRSSRRCSGS
jgi:hypothetical protein